MLKKIFILGAALFLGMHLSAQNWTTHCGNNERNGRSKLPGPQLADSPVWTVNDATPTAIGMNIYSFGDLFVTSRVDFSPYTAVIECRDLMTGELVWTSPDLGEESILYAMGFNEDAVYAHDYNSNIFYALDPSSGMVKWGSDALSYTFGPMDGVIFTCGRDVIINGDLGSVDASTICLEKETGDVKWTNTNWFAVTPNESKAAHGDRLYLITGAINQPKKLAAVDLETGDNLYYSDELPGDGDQEGPVAVGPDGTVFFRRDGGDLYAIHDTGDGFEILWTFTPISEGLVKNYSVDFKGNLLLLDNGRVYRLNALNGQVMDSSMLNTFDDGRIVIGSDSLVYINNAGGAYYALSYDLQSTIWSLPGINLNVYSGPALSKDGFMVVCGSGSVIRGYQYAGPHSPVGDFIASAYKVGVDEPVDFFDQSSFQATSWHWQFPGGNPESSMVQNPPSISYGSAGVYDVTLIVSNELGTDTITKHCLIEVEDWIGVPGKDQLANILVYPNPAKENVRIASDYASSLEIIDATGRVVYQDNAHLKHRNIKISGFPSGIYIIRLKNEDREGRILSGQQRMVIE